MAPLEWKDSYSVGVPAVDHEHQELIDLVNRLHVALEASGAGGGGADEVRDIFSDLYRAISAHFALEERFMREHRYDQLAQHKADHEQLLDQLRDIMDDYADGMAGAAERLAEAVDAWFVNHFKTHDARLHSRLGAHPH